jgi:hypothetical protein
MKNKITLQRDEDMYGYMSWKGKRGGLLLLSLRRSRGIYFLHCFMYTTEHGHSILAYCHVHESLLYTFCLYCV